MKDIKEKNNRTRHGLYSRLLALLLTLALCMGMMPVSALAVEAAEEESAVTLNLEDGNIVIEPDGYTQYNQDTEEATREGKHTGAYVITGSVTGANTPLLLKNGTYSEVTYDITLENVSSWPDDWSTAILMKDANAGITLNLTNRGESEIYSYKNFPAIYNESSQLLTVNLYVMSGSLTLGNTDLAGSTGTKPAVIPGETDGLVDNVFLHIPHGCTVTSDGNSFNNEKNTTFVSTHTFTDNENGAHSFSCDKCQDTEVTIEPHTLYYTDNGDGTHSATCSCCGAEGTTASHTLGTAEVTKDPGEEEPGECEQICTVCGAVVTSSIAPTGGYWLCLYDDRENGWDGASLSVYLNGEETRLTLEDNESERKILIPVNAGDTFVLIFYKGISDAECSLKLYAPGSSTVLCGWDDLSGAGHEEILYSNRELADYSAVEEAIAAVPSDLLLYTSDSRENLLETIDQVIYYLGADSQIRVDAYAQAILDAAEVLELLGEGEDEGLLSLEIGDWQRLIITSTGYRWDDDEEEIAYTGAYYLTTGGEETYVYGGSVLVESGTHFIVLDDLNLVADFDEYSPFAISPGANVWLCLENDNSLVVFEGSDVAGLNVPTGASLCIAGSGSLYAVGHDECAGIGGNRAEGGGRITVASGTVTAVGGELGAGIGGGYGGNGGRITITGGTVTATGASFGAGIGGGEKGSGGKITISGGTVTATTVSDEEWGGIGGFGAAIGGGDYGSGGEITISGGTVTAAGKGCGAGIGGGYGGSGGLITISGGTVTATTVADGEWEGFGAAIGGGYDGEGGEIIISGGTVEATGAEGAGIGGGAFSGGGEITISGGTVTATASYGAAIGGGIYGSGGQITISGGVVAADSSDGNIMGNGYENGAAEGETNFVIIDSASVFSETPDNINPAPMNSEGVSVFHQSFTSDSEDGYVKATLSDGSIWLVYVKNNEISLYLPDGLTLEGADYTAVDEAIDAAGQLNKDNYVDFSGVDKAIDAVIYGLYTDSQGEVDAMAQAIRDAISALRKICTLSFDTAGGNAIAAVTAAGNTQVDLSGYTTTRDGYTFGGWNTAADGTGTSYAADGVFTITEDTTLHAVWTDDPATESGTGSGDGAAADTTPIAAGQTYSDGNYYYRVTSITDMTAEVVGQNNTSITKVQIYDTVVLYGESFTVTAVAAGAFKGNKNITSVTMKKNLVSIGANAFSGCTKLKTVTIGSTVLTGIGANAFSGCTSLKKVTIKSKILKSIGKQAFKGDKKLTRITLKTTKLKSVGKKALSGISAKCVIKVPKAKKTAYTKLFKRKGQKSTVKVR